MNCEEYVIERIEKLEDMVDELREQLADKEAEIRKNEMEIIMLKNEKEQVRRILALSLRKDEDGDLRIEMPTTLYGWNHRDEPKIEELTKIFGLVVENENDQ